MNFCEMFCAARRIFSRRTDLLRGTWKSARSWILARSFAPRANVFAGAQILCAQLGVQRDHEFSRDSLRCETTFVLSCFWGIETKSREDTFRIRAPDVRQRAHFFANFLRYSARQNFICLRKLSRRTNFCELANFRGSVYNGARKVLNGCPQLMILVVNEFTQRKLDSD